MTYTVVWKPSALDQLAELWTSELNRQAVSTAANEVERWLRHDPDLKGESRKGNERFVIVQPLAVVIEVRRDDRIVEILSVRDIHVGN